MVIHGAFSSDGVVVSGPGMAGTEIQTSRHFFATSTRPRQTETDGDRQTDGLTDRDRDGDKQRKTDTERETETDADRKRGTD